MMQYRVSVFANVESVHCQRPRTSLGVCYMSSDDVMGRHWGTRGCHLINFFSIKIRSILGEENIIFKYFFIVGDISA